MSAVATPQKSTKTRAASDRGQVQRLILGLKAEGKQTAKQLGVTPVIVNYVARQGLIKSTGKTVKTGQRGRPAHIYVLTDAGRSAARKIIRNQTKA